MAVNLSIKGVSDEIAEQLRRRAARNHRSLQGELMAIIEESVRGKKKLDVKDLFQEVRASGLQTPAESAQMIRAERDERYRR